ncbi:Predicted dithiol-disulfide isomerase, DsbA family [Parasphingorhabdus marina DSM 22363]|uniref:Predicted dithiol-disulfide isomerase, DsbA family n=1 Tax=Parasphingorhabdus marina DSM 22363 TaxID=1123272 RepID=A0A1N6D6K1_9SPHN|nr:DsbA family oxidoreductase [Parasphingorhabdus marina]SIN66460.1 Predicted dithiol-disulfide isomerase, DsbA family [Parasphingorhabdus marina DSM 22363]
MSETPVVTVDIVSDVVCPWCIIGFKKLEQAMQRFEGKARFELAWHAFELNPGMPPEGQDINEHMAQKYGATPEQSKANRDRLRDAGSDLDFEFQYRENMRMVNTFDAHRLLHWAGETGKQTELKLALFKAHFTDGQDVSDHETLVDIAKSVGLSAERAANILETGMFAPEVRAVEAEWQDRFITGVPAFIFNKKFMVPGAQDSDVFAQIIESKILAKAA